MQKGDVGVKMYFYIQDTTGTLVDLTDASSVSLLIRKPNNQVISRQLTITNPSRGEVYYLTDGQDFDVVGTYQLQIKIVFSNSVFYTKVFPEKVDDSLE